MVGSEFFKFAVRHMPQSSINVIEKPGLKKEDIDYLIPHQANIGLMEADRKRLDIPEDRMANTVQHYGNNSSAAIQIALSESSKQGTIKDADKIATVEFGGGLPGGAMARREET